MKAFKRGQTYGEKRCEQKWPQPNNDPKTVKLQPQPKRALNPPRRASPDQQPPRPRTTRKFEKTAEKEEKDRSGQSAASGAPKAKSKNDEDKDR